MSEVVPCEAIQLIYTQKPRNFARNERWRTMYLTVENLLLTARTHALSLQWTILLTLLEPRII
jgi:hypothetical protein